MKYYVYRLDEHGATMNVSYGTSKTEPGSVCPQRDALIYAKRSHAFKSIKGWAGTLVVYSPVPWEEIEEDKHKGLWDYWVYDRTGNVDTSLRPKGMEDD